MRCGTSDTSFSSTVTNRAADGPQAVGDWSGERGLYLVSIRADKPARVTVKWNTDRQVGDECTFDVTSAERFVIAGGRVEVLAYMHLADGKVAFALTPVAAWFSSDVLLHYQLPTGATDGASDTKCQPPRHARWVRLDPSHSNDFTLDLYDPDGNLVGTYTKATLPERGALLGYTSRLVATCDGPTRLTYGLRL